MSTVADAGIGCLYQPSEVSSMKAIMSGRPMKALSMVVTSRMRPVASRMRSPGRTSPALTLLHSSLIGPFSHRARHLTLWAATLSIVAPVS